MLEIKRITSRENRRVVRARRIRDGREPAWIFIEGKRLAREAISSGLEIDECFVVEDLGDTKLLDLLEKNGIEISELPRDLMRSISATEQPQGIILIARRPSHRNFDLRTDGHAVPVYVYLHEVNNPSNLGAVLRCVEASGAAGVFVSANSADVYSPKALRSSMGSAFRMNIAENVILSDVITMARQAGLGCLAVDASGSGSYLEIDWRQPHLLVFGSEAHGLSDDQLRSIGRSINIPMEQPVESLNLAVAAGVVLFEAKRRQKN